MVQSILLNFEGPYYLNDLTSKNIGDIPGVYIWGFSQNLKLLSKDKKHKNNDKKIFIPYYVGLSETSIRKRIHSEIFNEIGLGKLNIKSTWKRLIDSYMQEYFRDPWLWDCDSITDRKNVETLINNNDLASLIKNFLYINPYMIHKDIQVNNSLKNSAFNNSIQDPLRSHISSSFEWFFCEITTETKIELLKKNSKATSYHKHICNLEFFEAFTKYSLQGKTIGKSISFKLMNSIMKNLCINIQFQKTNYQYLVDSPPTEWELKDNSKRINKPPIYGIH